MEHKLKIKEISEEPILVRETNKYSSSLPRLSMDKDGRLVLFTNNMNKYLRSAKAFVVILLATVLSCTAYGQEFEDVTFEGGGGEVAEWKTLTNAFGGAGNAPDVQGSEYGFSIKQLTPGAIITSTGNIYNPGGVSKFSLTDSSTGILKKIVLQVWTSGVPLDYDSFELVYGESTIKGTATSTSGDNGVITKVLFNLGDNEINNSDYSVNFNASGAHMSLVSVRLDLIREVSAFAFKKLYYGNGEFAEWDKFTVGFGVPGNSADVDGSKDSALITQNTPGAMATGSGNIYNPGGISQFVLNDTISGKLKSIVLQVWTKGSPANYGSFKLNSGDIEITGSREEIASGDEGVISLFNFNLNDSKIEDADYSISFAASGPHMSLASSRLDIELEPEFVYEFQDFETENSEYAEWDEFTVGFGEPGNAPDMEFSKGGIKITQNTPGAMATSTGNIYNPGGVSDFILKDSALGKLDEIRFQIWTLGSPADYGSFVLRSGDNEVSGIRSEVVSGDKGVISLINFDIAEASILDADYSIQFTASGPHMSLVAARLDYKTKEVIIDFQEQSGPGWVHDGWVEFANGFNDWNEPDLEGSREVSFDFGALLRQTTPGAFVTSTKNIYNPGGISNFEISDNVDGEIVRLALQVRTTGTPVNPGSAVIKIGETELRGAYREVARKKTARGSEVISQFVFDLNDIRPSEYLIKFSAAGPHMSLVSARVDKQITPKYELGSSYNSKFNLASEDRWTYPRNSTPGKRNLAPVFGLVSGEGDDRYAQRYGQMIVAFDTISQVPSGLHYSQYKIKSATVKTTVALDEQFLYDGTPDDYSEYNGVDDTVSPVELFGTGFRNGFDSSTWNETSPMAAPDGDRSNNAYSLGLSDGQAIDVDLYRFGSPHNASAFAIGQIDGLEQGELVPEDSELEFSINVDDSGIQRYIAESLSKGKLFFTLSQILYAKTDNGGKGYPDLYTKDHILGESPTLNLEFEIVPAKLDPAVLTISRNNNGGVTVGWSGNGDLFSSEKLGDGVSWQKVGATGNSHDLDPASPARYFKVIEN